MGGCGHGCDVVSGDLKQCNLLESWREKAEECNSWHSNVVHSISTRNQKTKRRSSEVTENDSVNNS